MGVETCDWSRLGGRDRDEKSDIQKALEFTDLRIRMEESIGVGLTTQPFTDTSQQPSKTAAVQTKKPPPESSDSVRVRSLVVASFWAIAVCLGLPIWWWTTSIPRARLPLKEMLEWADGKV